MRRLAGVAALVAAVALPVEAAAGVPGEVRLASAADVQALCREVAPLGEEASAYRRGEREEALGSLYVMTLPSSAFGFRAFDAARGRLPLEPRFRPSPPVYELVLKDLDGEDAERPLLVDLALPTSAREAALLAKQRRAGELSLTLWFRLPAAGQAVCAAVHRRDGSGVRLAIDPVAFELARRGQVIGGAEAAAFAELREASMPAGERRVVVARPVLTRSRGQAPEAVARVATALEPELLGCYKGASGDPGLRGTLVVGVAVDGEGRVVEARPELDGLGSPRVAACVVSRLRAARFPRAAERFSMPVKFTSAVP